MIHDTLFKKELGLLENFEIASKSSLKLKNFQVIFHLILDRDLTLKRDNYL